MNEKRPEQFWHRFDLIIFRNKFDGWVSQCSSFFFSCSSALSNNDPHIDTLYKWRFKLSSLVYKRQPMMTHIYNNHKKKKNRSHFTFITNHKIFIQRAIPFQMSFILNVTRIQQRQCHPKKKKHLHNKQSNRIEWLKRVENIPITITTTMKQI